MFDWNRLTFLESTANLKPLLATLTGRTPSTTRAREVAVCLQQGRLFFQSAGRSAIEIRPLLYFYGTAAFAKALIMARTGQALTTLPRAHGVVDSSRPDARTIEMTVRIRVSGAFHPFNDQVAQLNGFRYYDRETARQLMVLPAVGSAELHDRSLSLRAILSHLPGVEELYTRTFREPADSQRIMLDRGRRDENYWELRIDDAEIFTDRITLVRIVRRLRAAYPILGRWRVTHAERGYGKSIIIFGNFQVPENEFDEGVLREADLRFSLDGDPEAEERLGKTPIREILTPTGGMFTGVPSLVRAIDGVFYSEYALHYLGMFLLSSLVRYRPKTWVHAVTRTATSETPADDQALALIEAFMELHERMIPELLASVLTGESE